MTVSEVRKRYLDFFAKREHKVIPSAPIVPENDPTTLFTSSGMQPLVPYLLGAPHPEGARLVDSQISFRAGDIEEVGDNRHTTFFEMLGNWSLGDYFKKEQLPWFYEFLTEELGLATDRLWVTCFAGDSSLNLERDEESAQIWREIGIPEERIKFYDAKKNWWSRSGPPGEMPAGEIGGPDSEVFYDYQTPHDPAFGPECHPNCDCGRFIEIGNSVFMQFIKQADGSFKDLPKKNVDFGGGLERLTAATRHDPDVFMINVFDAARGVLAEKSGKVYGADEEVTKSYRIILDHTRAATFILAAGIRPGPSEQGYILRRLIRRAIREADRLGIRGAVLADVAAGYADAYKDQYTSIYGSAATIRAELEKEEAQFRKTLALGLTRLSKALVASTATGEKLSGDKIDAALAFDLYTTYGFPIELTLEEGRARGLTVDVDGFNALMKKHQEESRAGAAQKFAGGLADHAEQTIKYHTAHHILLKALQMVLGSEVHQRGSNITSERLRIDFSFNRKMAPEEITRVEEIVNEQIREELPVTRTVMRREDAEKLGAEHEFGASYPEAVSVYSVGPKDASETEPKFSEAFSIEFCGGPHVSNTAELGSVRDPDGSDRKGALKFKVKKEEASSAGVRRIKAVLE